MALGGEEARKAPDEFECIAQTLLVLDNKQKATEADFAKTLNDAAANIAKISEGKVSVMNLTTEAGKAFANALEEMSRKVSSIKQRYAVSVKILREINIPIIAVDDAGIVRFTNAAFEKIFDKANLLKKEFHSLLADPLNPLDPFGRKIQSREEFQSWLSRGGQGEVIVELPGEEPRTRLSLRSLRLTNSMEGIWYLTGRDLSEEYSRASFDRAEIREQTLRAIWSSTSQASTESIETILASTRLLTSDAKQGTDRDIMLSRANSLRQHSGSLEAYLRTIRWLNMSLWGELPKAMNSEFQIFEPAKAAIDQLMSRFKSRNITVVLNDKGGWIVADEEWLRTALIGILLHAVESVNDATIGVQTQHLPPLPNGTQDRVVYEIVDAGPVLTSAQMADLEHPFGNLVTPSYLAPNSQGYIPGLILAADLARRMGGTLEFGATPGGGLVVRFVLPTRVITDPIIEPATESGDNPVFEELVIGWKLAVA
jgi:PAS domain-containing protein